MLGWQAGPNVPNGYHSIDPAMTGRLDIDASRRAAKWTRRELFHRFLWELAQPILRLIPRQFWSLRCSFLRIFGARIGREVRIHRAVQIAIPWNLSIADEAAIGELCAGLQSRTCVDWRASDYLARGASLRWNS
jgi:hypothetical protein